MSKTITTKIIEAALIKTHRGIVHSMDLAEKIAPRSLKEPKSKPSNVAWGQGNYAHLQNAMFGK